MAKHSRKQLRWSRCGNRSSSRKSRTGLVQTKTNLTQKERSQALHVYIDKLVKMKIKSKLDKHRLPNATYNEYYLLLKKLVLTGLLKMH